MFNLKSWRKFRGAFAGLCVVFSLVLFASLFSPFASLAAADPRENPCKVEPGSGPGGIPDTFSVKNCLTTEQQKNSQFVPSDKNSEGAAAGSGASTQNVSTVLIAAIDLFVKIIGSIALVVFILGALLAITSEGKEDRLEKGKTAMIYSLLGMIFALLSFVMVSFVQSILFK